MEYSSSAVLDPRRDEYPRRTGGSPPNKRGTGKGAKGKGRRKDPLWAKLLVIFGALLMLGSGTLIFGYKAVVAEATKSFDKQNLLGAAGNDRQHATITGAKNILLVGVDSRPDQPATDLVRADSIMIMHISAGHDRAYLISIPRDTYVEIPSYNNGKYKYPGGHEKINAAFAFGGENLTGKEARQHGVELLAETIKTMYSGITFDAAAIVDFQGFQQVVQVLGGVNMCVDEDTKSIHIGYNKNGKTVSPAVRLNSDGTVAGPIAGVTPKEYKVGCYHFAPWEALDYVRQRDLLANQDADYGRQRHQQQFLKAIFKEMLSAGTLTNPAKLTGVLSTVGKAMTIDDGNIDPADWVYAMRNIGANDLTTIKTNNGKFVTQIVNGQSVQILDDTSLQLLQDVKNDTVDTFIATHPDWVSTS